MSKLIDLKINEFVDLLASNAPAPGGGSAAALSAAMGISLTRMVCALTIGKKKYAEYETLAREISIEAETINSQLLEHIDRDTQAYNAVSAVFTMPKDTDEEKQVRKTAMEAALKQAAEVPFQVMELSLQALKLTQKAVGKTNPNTASDLGVAALTLFAGLQGAWLNVKINLSGIKDQDFIKQHNENGQIILQEAEIIAEHIRLTSAHLCD